MIHKNSKNNSKTCRAKYSLKLADLSPPWAYSMVSLPENKTYSIY